MGMWARALLAPFAVLALSTVAQAQDAPNAAPAAAPAPPALAAPPAPASAYSADEMHRFAHATVELQLLRQQDAASRSRASQDAGMSVEDYNQMGDAMRADPALASRLNPYIDAYNSERAQRLMAARRSDYERSAPARSTRHAKAHARSSRQAHASAHSGRHAHKATKASHKGKASRHASSGRKQHTASKPAKSSSRPHHRRT